MAWKQNDPTAFDAEGAVSMSQAIAKRLQDNLAEHAVTRLRKASAVWPAGVVDFDLATDDPIDYQVSRFAPDTSASPKPIGNGSLAESPESIGLQISTHPYEPYLIRLPFAFSSFAAAVRVRITATARNHGTGGGVQILPAKAERTVESYTVDGGDIRLAKYTAACITDGGGIDIAVGDVAGSSTYCYYETTIPITTETRGQALEVARSGGIELLVRSYLDPSETSSQIEVGAKKGSRYEIEPSDYYSATGQTSVMPGSMHAVIYDADLQRSSLCETIVTFNSGKGDAMFRAKLGDRYEDFDSIDVQHLHLPRLVISAITIEEVNE